MTLTQLRAFLAASELGSFTAAGRQLGYSQAAVSELIKRLEAECGLQLFHRGHRQLTLSSAGASLIPHAQQAVSAASNAATTMRSLRGLTGGVATFGLFRNADYYLLAELAERFTSAHPDVRLRLVGTNSALVARAVAAGELEAGIVVLPVTAAGLEVIPVARDEVLYASANAGNVLAPIDITALASRRLILYDAHVGWEDPDRLQLARRAELAGITLEAFMEVEQAQTALHLAARGVGDTLVSRAVIDRTADNEAPAVHTTTMDPPLHNIFAVIRRRDVQLSPATEELTRLALELLLRNHTLERVPPTSTATNWA